jgi:protein-S-isoprenylcysteine O-methyltransferase Ste14
LATKCKNKAFRWRHVWGALLLIPTTVAALLSVPAVRRGSTLDVILTILAWLALLGGECLRFWSTLYIGGRKGREVVCDGPYSLCRHPLYVGTFLLGLSGGLFLESSLIVLGVLLLGVVYATKTIPVEEQHLIDELGQEYRSYCERTWGLLPDFRKFTTPAFVEVKMHSLRLEFRRGLIWLLLPALSLALNACRAQSWWPHLFRLPFPLS